MPTEKVLKGLEELHQQLNRMQPAIYHVEMAQELTKQVKRIPEHHLEFMEKMKGQDLKYKTTLSNELKTYATLLSEEVEKLLKTADSNLKSIKEKQQQVENLKNTVENLVSHLVSMQVAEKLNDIQITQNKGLKALTDTVELSQELLEAHITKVEEKQLLLQTDVVAVQQGLKAFSDKAVEHLIRIQRRQTIIIALAVVIGLLVIGLGVFLRMKR